MRWFQSESLSLQGVTKSPGSSQNQSGSRRNDTWSQLYLVFRSPCFQWGATRIGKFVRLGGFSSTNQGNFWPGLHRNCLRRDRWAIEKDIPSEVFMRTPEFHDNPECRLNHEARVYVRSVMKHVSFHTKPRISTALVSFFYSPCTQFGLFCPSKILCLCVTPFAVCIILAELACNKQEWSNYADYGDCPRYSTVKFEVIFWKPRKKRGLTAEYPATYLHVIE